MRSTDEFIIKSLKIQTEKIKELRIKSFQNVCLKTEETTEKKADSNVFYCRAVRPWTSSCIRNLYFNLQNNWSPTMTAEETKRDLQEVIFLSAMLKIYGFEELYLAMLRKELNFGVSNEIRFLQKLGFTI